MKFTWMVIAGMILTGLAVAVFWGPGFSLADLNNQGNQERTMSAILQAKLSPGDKIPPIDAALPTQTETAAFALG
jgi:hypothetical protein